ncbi:HNH endonuclease [Microcoleus sp. herbarium7]|uniref:HNH endonuclease n=1 Tax=Microcoleus sp. herbarium7 TaxID=3055435 RepID=UPI002FD576BD
MSPASRRNKRRQLLELYGNQCHWCNKSMQKSERTIEHLLPKSLGGSNALYNLRLACFSCNNSRGNSLFPPGKNLRTQGTQPYEKIAEDFRTIANFHS